uniref:Secreted protein n=1 Tax=Glossina palpalis gambiensis TaxID=67801 RepID=A0A1B0BKB8_9MUSC
MLMGNSSGFSNLFVMCFLLLISVPVLVDNLSAVVVVEEAELPDDELPAQLFTAVTAKKLLVLCKGMFRC